MRNKNLVVNLIALALFDEMSRVYVTSFNAARYYTRQQMWNNIQRRIYEHYREINNKVDRGYPIVLNLNKDFAIISRSKTQIIDRSRGKK